NPIIASVNCEDENTIAHVRNFNIQNVGLFTIMPNCKCYTLSTLLVASSNQSANFTNYIPPVNINGDDCCVKKQSYLTSDEMETVKLHDLDLDDTHSISYINSIKF
ncbi:hypothetical protein HHI36_014603, partial [Cryptolaemus montrouzieri]